MHTSRRSVLFAALIGAAFWIGGCAPKTIGHVLADPGRYSHRAVTVSGEVVHSYSVLGHGAYELRDHTGRLWVVSNRGVPRQGTRVRVKGTVRDLVAVGPWIPAHARFGTLFYESKRKVRD